MGVTILREHGAINYGSFMAMKIARIKPNINDKTIRLNTAVIHTMAADFDGDQENIFRIIGVDLGKRFTKNMNPRYNMYIDHIDGKINRDFSPMKDEAIGLYLFLHD